MKAKAYCIAYGCLNNNKDPNLTFFSLPMDIERRRKWLKLIDREELLQKEDLKRNSYLVCSAHFEDSSVKIIRHLKENALPLKFSHTQSQAGSSSKQDEDEKDVDCVAKAAEATQSSLSPVYKKYFTVYTQTDSLGTRENQTQTLNSYAAELSRKRKLANELRECKSKRRKLDKEITKMKMDLEATKLSMNCNDPDNKICRSFQKLIEWHNKIKSKYNGNRYDAEFKVFALNLRYSSPHAYRSLQTLLKLPCKSTLNRFKINIPSNFDNRVLHSLALKLKSLPDAAKHCTICVDEIPLKRNLFYNTNTDEVIGFHNVNGKISPEIASNAFVIMLQGIYFNWKQPIAYALLATVKDYEQIDLWMKEVIRKLSKIGVKVKAIVSDQGLNFDKFAKDVKQVTIEKPYFMYDDTKIYYIFDVPHLIKCIRNYLLTSDFIHDGKRISWDFIEQLYKDQKDRNLKLLPKITDAHIQPNNCQKMGVELAVQTLSRTVSAALHTYIDLGKISEEARPTANFVELMNDLFDVLNSSKTKTTNKFQTAFRLSKDQENILNNAKEMFAVLEAINRKNGKNNKEHIKSFVNFQISIESIKMLYEDLKKDGFTYLLTRRLNQENLESFFDAIREQGVPCSKPTPIKFRQAFSKLFLCNMLKGSPYANSEMDICDVLLKTEDLMNIQLFRPVTSTSLGSETDYRINLPDENALTYVSGYLFFKCVNKHKCSEINKVLETLPDLGETNMFTRFTFNKKSGLHGGLKMPPNEFIEYVQNLETVFMQNSDIFNQNNPGGELLKLFKNVPEQTPCNCFPVNYLLKLFAKFRIYTTLKINNRQFKDGRKGIKKCVTVSHL